MGFVRRHPVLVTLLGVAVLTLGVVGLTGVAVWRAAHNDDARRIDHTDLIVVLGAAQYGGDPSPAFAGRLRHAAILFEQGRSSTVLVVGGGQPGDLSTEAEAGRDYLVSEQGLPAEAVVALPEGSTTLESLEAAERFMSDRGLHSAFLVSDPWHNLRIKRMAGDLGIEAYASATWQSAFRSESSRLSGYARETFAYLYYRVFGG